MDSHDWQISCKNLKERGNQLLQSGQWTDCTFLVGQESNQISIKGHKLFLAMASPVFEAMFYGGIPERNDPIFILDVQPEAFKALLEYIYSDKININSFDKACELCYAAKKYMLPHLVQECTNFLWSDLHPKNACRAYEFAKLFEEPVLMDRCLQIICTQTPEVLSESSFEDIELETMVKIFEQENLNIDSELELFDAAVRYANAQANNQSQAPQRLPARYNQTHSLKASKSQDNVPSMSGEGNVFASNDETLQNPQSGNESTKIANDSFSPSSISIKNAVQKIRFLTLTPQQFAEGPARTNLLSQAEAFAILMNISSSKSDLPMPEGFSTLSHRRNKENPRKWIREFVAAGTSGEVRSHRSLSLPFEEISADPQVQQINPNNENREINKYYCKRSFIHEMDCLNTSVLDSSVTFTVDRNICVIGFQIPTQVLGKDSTKIPLGSTYPELLYAHLLDSDSSRLTYTHYTSRVHYSRLLDVTFNRPVYIQRNKVYKVDVVFNKYGWYPIGSGSQQVICTNSIFNFGVGPSSGSVRDGLIRSIIFTL